MTQGTSYTEETLLESMKHLSYSMKKVESILTEKKPIGYYESDVEYFRKYNTGKSVKRLSY